MDWQEAVLFLFWPTTCCTPHFECGSPGTYRVKFSFCHCPSYTVNLLVGRAYVTSGSSVPGTVLAHVLRRKAEMGKQSVKQERVSHNLKLTDY